MAYDTENHAHSSLLQDYSGNASVLSSPETQQVAKYINPNANGIDHREEDNGNIHTATSAVTPTDSTGNKLINKSIAKILYMNPRARPY